MAEEFSMSDVLNDDKLEHFTGIKQIKLQDETLANELHQHLRQLRDENILCDVTLCVEDQSFPAHRVVLAAFSSYFKAMFTGPMRESHQHEVTITGVGEAVMKQLLEYGYTGTLIVNTDNVQSLLSGAHMLSVNGVVNTCCRFLQGHLTNDNCLGILQLADTLYCEELRDATNKFVSRNFENLLEETEWLELSVTMLASLLQLQELNVSEEEVVCDAVFRWLHHDHASRAPQLHRVLKWVRLCQVSPYYLCDVVKAEPAVSSSAECRSLVDEAREWHLLPDRRLQLSASLQPSPRRGHSTVVGALAVWCKEVQESCRIEEMYFWNSDAEVWVKLQLLPQELSDASCRWSWDNRKDITPSYLRVCVPGGGTTLYVLGSCTTGRFSRLNGFYFFKYDTILDLWTNLSDMPSVKYKIGKKQVALRPSVMVALNDCLYVVSSSSAAKPDKGLERPTVISVDVYSTTDNKWSRVPPPPLKVRKPAVAALAGRLYLCGGSQGSGEEMRVIKDDVQVYNPYTKTWGSCSSMLTARCTAACAVLDGKLYISGGCTDSLIVTDKVERYDPDKDKWEEIDTLDCARQHHGMTSLHGRLYVMGGVDCNGDAKVSIEEFVLAENCWKLMNSTVKMKKSNVAAITVKTTNFKGRSRKFHPLREW